MRLALIPPRGMEEDALRSTIHLALAQNTWTDYVALYDAARARGDFIIVDNGAAEGATVGDLELMSAARRLRADEIVVPDVIGQGRDTIDRMKQFFKVCAREIDAHRYKFMGVVQGKSEADVKLCLAQFAENASISTIGIPRHLITTLNKPTARIDIGVFISQQFPERFQVHLLGTNRSYLRELYYLGRYHTWARSCDTSAPYVYAAEKVLLPYNSRDPIRPMARPHQYFDKVWQLDAQAVSHNVEVLSDWCVGRDSKAPSRRV